MTEKDWLACTDPREMLTFLQGMGLLSERKARLFAAAASRRLSYLYRHPDAAKCVEVAERFADGLATSTEVEQAEELAMWAGDDASWRSMQEAAELWASAAPAHHNCFMAAQCAIEETGRVYCEDLKRWDAERQAQCLLLRDIAPDPFCPRPRIQATWLAWDDGTVKRLAEEIYNERSLPDGYLDVMRMGVLADALEDAGCDNADILNHCRSAGPHVRGCWVVDLLLGKE